MQLSKSQRMQLFIDSNYFTLAEVARQSGVSEAEILTLETAQCIPGHTYEVRQIITFSCAGIDSALTENTDLITTFYYHHSIIIWVKEALFAAKNMSLAAVALQVKDNFAKQLKIVFGDIKTPGCQNFEQAWGYWIDGTWGKCLKEISVDCLSQKELSRQRIAEIIEEDPVTATKEIRTELTNAVKNYIVSSLDFDAYGMRHLLAKEAIDKFRLEIEIDQKYLSGNCIY